ncbi:MAG: 5-(carboxyamino)imidazole ribonucleotide mutase [Spirochaetia bacterium]|nr:5-(carboxyamino)imidazole ribonucleotide mutase [Spirochaetia bacterium]
MNYKVAIVMGSDSDLPLAKETAQTLKELGIDYTCNIYSAHRTPDEATDFAKKAREKGYGTIIAIAGKAAHLAGVLASQTTLPVIGVPTSSSLEGLDALLATVQMPSGIPVATVAVDGAKNAALLAAQMLAITDAQLATALEELRAKQKENILGKNKDLAI